MQTVKDTLFGIYHPGEWILFFYIYCFFGWIWECCYVSIVDKHLENRGFMYGPCIPIYGFGALLILIITMPFRGSYALMALAAMVSASVLEYVTGAAMEALFKVRYWDYSTNFANLNGYICLSSTLAWGVMAMILVYGLQPFLAGLLVRVPYAWILRTDAMLLTIGAADFALSFKAAIDLRVLLERTEKLRKEITGLRERIAQLQKQVAETASEAKTATINMASGAKAATLGKASEAKAATLEYAAAARIKAENELRELRLLERFNTEKIRSFTTGSIQKLLRRNPGAVSNIYKDAFETVKNGIRSAFRENSMEERIEERFVSGFCKAQNQTRTVLCEYEQDEKGEAQLVETDCAYGSCAHQDACILMREALGQKSDS